MDPSQVRGKEVPEETSDSGSPGEQREKIREAVGCEKVPAPQQRHHRAQTPAEIPSGSRLGFPLLRYRVSPLSNTYQIDAPSRSSRPSSSFSRQPPPLWRGSSDETRSSVLMNWTPCSPTSTPAQGLAVSVAAPARRRRPECSLSFFFF